MVGRFISFLGRPIFRFYVSFRSVFILYIIYIYIFAASEGMYHRSLKYKVAKSDSHQSQLHRGDHFYMAGEWTMNKHAFHISSHSIDKGYNNLLLSSIAGPPAESTLDPVMGPPLLMEAACGNGILCLAIYVGFMAICF